MSTEETKSAEIRGQDSLTARSLGTMGINCGNSLLWKLINQNKKLF